VADIAAGIDRRLASLGKSRPPGNVSFVINCRERVAERKWRRTQRRVCAALERRYIEADGRTRPST
jgi:hypothetical protein